MTMAKKNNEQIRIEEMFMEIFERLIIFHLSARTRKIY